MLGAIVGIALGMAAQPALVDCVYAAKGGGELVEHHACGRVDGGRLVLAKHHLAALSFDRHGLAEVGVAGGWFYVARDGRSASVMTLDNGPDPFKHGLARSEQGGKVGFIDRSLRLVIRRRFDGALPFEHGRALVCVGCAVVTYGVHETYAITDDVEHPKYPGGHWLWINTRGVVVEREPDSVPLPPSATPPPALPAPQPAARSGTLRLVIPPDMGAAPLPSPPPAKPLWFDATAGKAPAGDERCVDIRSIRKDEKGLTWFRQTACATRKEIGAEGVDCTTLKAYFVDKTGGLQENTYKKDSPYGVMVAWVCARK